jgi:SOS response regulatory protein OraA/RecX
MGRLRLEVELQSQGFDERTIAATLEELYCETSEREVAVKLIEARVVTPAFMRRRGFSEDTIESVFGGA